MLQTLQLTLLRETRFANLLERKQLGIPRPAAGTAHLLSSRLHSAIQKTLLLPKTGNPVLQALQVMFALKT
jgi:hypothetical protein